ncbi:metallophosphoesterase [Convivina intestini]|uniref:Putative phosphoesterase n=1 Tax=Convivina intestini TaxID=1505726 RepID=A0A2U1D874_9LACO|nr:metallophosphoesterase [Convivina intestini]PVY83722.1 putative phosphoesterase [Convivina intestini]CAH1855074.1 hypothetical protein R077811_00987 [Convivina intestini]SDB92421.1 putative phosphoesterase [Leuconostocaceae bacterium R-53105]
MKLAFSSDNHFDVNRLSVDELLPRQAEYLVQNQIDLYIIAGDLFNDFSKSLAYCRRLSEIGQGSFAVRFLAGNHDMASGVTYEELESDIDPLYFHNKSLDIGDSYRLIGNNGWYDYGFDNQNHPKAEIEHFKHELWYDRRIQQPMSDPERCLINLQQIENQIKQADGRKLILVDHFVPIVDFVDQLPYRNPRLKILNAFLGSPKLGELADQSPVVATISGHLHLHLSPINHGKNTYYNSAVGYQTRRIHEWQSDNFMTEWQQSMVFLTV